MKLTNKILFVFLILLVLSVTAYKIVFNSKVELIPNPIDKTSYTTKNISFDSEMLNEFELKGRFIVYINRIDTTTVTWEGRPSNWRGLNPTEEQQGNKLSKVIIEGPDNLVYNYLSVEQRGNKLSINSKIDLSKYYHIIRIYCYTNTLKSINASGGTIVSVGYFIGDSLDVTARDSSIVKADVRKCFNVKVHGRDKSMVMVYKTKNALINLYDESSLLLTLDGGEVKGTIEKNTDFGLDGIVKTNSVERVTGNSKQTGGKNEK